MDSIGVYVIEFLARTVLRYPGAVLLYALFFRKKSFNFWLNYRDGWVSGIVGLVVIVCVCLILV